METFSSGSTFRCDSWFACFCIYSGSAIALMCSQMADAQASDNKVTDANSTSTTSTVPIDPPDPNNGLHPRNEPSYKRPAHQHKRKKPNRRKEKRKVCLYFARGRCKYGRGCYNSHDIQQRVGKKRRVEDDTLQKPISAAAHGFVTAIYQQNRK